MMTEYKRNRKNQIKAERAIILALREAGGSASRKEIRQLSIDHEFEGLTYDLVFYQIQGKKSAYTPFSFDFNFGIKSLYAVGFIEEPQRAKDLVLTELGSQVDLSKYPTDEQQFAIDSYWEKTIELRKKRKMAEEAADSKGEDDSQSSLETDIQEGSDNLDVDWKSQLLAQLEAFSPAKFESFSRLLISKMGVRIDKERGIVRSGDHGIDGFGYYTSDEFRTSRVAIQCKRYTTGAVSEPEIDRFKGVMDSFNA
ncbi:restriction endonuclease [Limosilactobacillus equigenerosi DSM 18793 = JCM 14505]|uniref:Restriction endonuclease n=1 Tax=Limosilactobacillus equigenerosi DSM 18793 = JCM 14505 TaxID=1423742 RepID=A0A0R1UT21_9LACO|nr:restriction endonuclease [Limosilactobacillus equigenerosi DSM 18793 = JCM 14505]